ncbi:hypothetical protein BN1058_00335 [Paraliobacillus sp. PM-2]|uniref:hypothetical protein n=1 Tax=Paraliobacillus sp. PM-2 TaxID=1462524 RepID=UPI00061C53F7|nr:hypothetical protein [Paraliobacillus sp. PM-2]CQR46088.1 hypothetical protein BN1058_00335 [Paraliobacillus sp. PM-2]
MEKKTIYLLFLDTGTFLTKIINVFTNSTLNHASIALDQSLTHVYSFGRKRPKNPFIGGFVRENLQSAFFQKSECAIYRLQISEVEYQLLEQRINIMETQKHLYRYNTLGLFGVMLNKELQRENAYFCSQFVATMLTECGVHQYDKPACLIRPQDLREWHELELIYQGSLCNYPYFTTTNQHVYSHKWKSSNIKLG